MEETRELSRQIRKMRHLAGWSQETLGAACGVQRPQISKIEKDATNASVVLLIAIAKAFGTKLIFVPKEEPFFRDIATQAH